jgi:hypothetical protein
MTSLHHDDSIEIISYDADCNSTSSAYGGGGRIVKSGSGGCVAGISMPSTASMSASATAAIETDCGCSSKATATAMAYVSFSAYPDYCADRPLRPTSATEARAVAAVGRLRRGRLSVPPEMLSPQYRRMRCAIIVMAIVMIIASVLLVGVSLSMAEHIDDLGELHRVRSLCGRKRVVRVLFQPRTKKKKCDDDTRTLAGTTITNLS